MKNLIRDRESANGAAPLLAFNKNINYLLSEADEEKGFLKFEAKTDIEIAQGLDIANFKKGILGKNSRELEDLIKNYPAVKSADVNFWPFFASRVPMRENRVKVEVE